MIVVSNKLNAQSLSIMSDLERQHQNCLDKGEDMLGCSRRYYLQMDSMLNMAYNNLRKKCSKQEKAKLKNEQISWLKKRDKYLKEQENEFQKEYKAKEWGSDMFMVVYDSDAEFIKERTLVLIRRANKN